MIGEDTISQTTPDKSDFNDLVIFKTVEMFGANISLLTDMMNIPGSEAAIKKSILEVDTRCEYDVLSAEIQSELKKARELLKTKFPFRYRWSLFKIFLSRDFIKLYSLRKKK